MSLSLRFPRWPMVTINIQWVLILHQDSIYGTINVFYYDCTLIPRLIILTLYNEITQQSLQLTHRNALVCCDKSCSSWLNRLLSTQRYCVCVMRDIYLLLFKFLSFRFRIVLLCSHILSTTHRPLVCGDRQNKESPEWLELAFTKSGSDCW